MRLGWHLASSTVLLLALLDGGTTVHAQSGRSWVDPPADLTARPKTPAPQNQAPPPSVGAAPSGAPQQAAPSPQPSPSIQSAQPDKPSARPEAPPAAQSAQTPQTTPPAETAKPQEIARPRGAEENRLASRAEETRQFVTSYLDSWSAPNDEALAAAADFYAPYVFFHGRNVSLRNLVREKRRFVRRWPERQYRPQQDSLKVGCEPSGRFCTVHAVFNFMAANPRRGRRTEGIAALQIVVSFADGPPVITAENSMVLDPDRRRRSLALEDASDD